MAAKVDSDHFQDQPAERDPGNLFTPTGPGGVSGGWKSSDGARSLGLAAAAVLGVVGLGVAAWWLAAPDSGDGRARRLLDSLT